MQLSDYGSAAALTSAECQECKGSLSFLSSTPVYSQPSPPTQPGAGHAIKEDWLIDWLPCLFYWSPNGPFMRCHDNCAVPARWRQFLGHHCRRFRKDWFVICWLIYPGSSWLTWTGMRLPEAGWLLPVHIVVTYWFFFSKNLCALVHCSL